MAAPTSSAPTLTTLPASITSPPTIQFVPPPECNDPANNWVVTTSCYVELPHTIAYPDWLTCTLSQFGNPTWYDPSCNIPQATESPSYQDAPKVTIDGVVSYYSGCPAGYSTARTASYPGWSTYEYENLQFDATAYNVQCCPTQYNFDLAPTGSDPRQQTSTLHDGINYSLFIYPLPACAATSIAQLAGKELPYQTWLNTMAWDKRRQVQTLSWDYEHGTMFANQRYFSYTVFQHTHTCYEYCDQWFTYYYPNGVGGTPGSWTTGEATTPTPTPESTPTPTPTPEPTSEPGTTSEEGPTSYPESTSEPATISEIDSTSEPAPTSDLPSSGDSTYITSPAETPSQSVPGSATASPETSTPSPHDSEGGSSSGSPDTASPSSTPPSGGSGSSSSTAQPTLPTASRAMGAVAPSLSAALIICAAVIMLG
ncbi:hypothetical protein F5B18DRAFT_595176 [Nemania serpens]|nr:hypothetical protein F5B18DRAFT_595176 [Nemania serpens]